MEPWGLVGTHGVPSIGIPALDVVKEADAVGEDFDGGCGGVQFNEAELLQELQVVRQGVAGIADTALVLGVEQHEVGVFRPG